MSTIVVRLTRPFGDDAPVILITARFQDQTQDLFRQMVHENDGFHLDLKKFAHQYPSLFMREPGGRIEFTDLIIEDLREETPPTSEE